METTSTSLDNSTSHILTTIISFSTAHNLITYSRRKAFLVAVPVITSTPQSIRYPSIINAVSHVRTIMYINATIYKRADIEERTVIRIMPKICVKNDYSSRAQCGFLTHSRQHHHIIGSCAILLISSLSYSFDFCYLPPPLLSLLLLRPSD